MLCCSPRISGRLHNLTSQFRTGTGAQPEGAFRNLVNWIGNVIVPVGAALAIVGGPAAYIPGRRAMRYAVTALGFLTVCGTCDSRYGEGCQSTALRPQYDVSAGHIQHARGNMRRRLSAAERSRDSELTNLTNWFANAAKSP